MSLKKLAASGCKTLLDAVLPPLCLACGAEVGEPGALCPSCWGQITFIAPPLCAACGLPFEYDTGAGTLCGACMDDPYPFAHARSVFRYDDASRPLILRFKHADRLEGAAAFARWMVRAGQEILTPDSLLMPVPLHRWRLFTRRYNQAALLARQIARQTGLEADMQSLLRVRATPSQGRLGRADRARNVRGAFQVAEHRRQRLQGRHIVLIDDVLTTGMTLAECTLALQRAGADRVDVLTLGRVVR